jgi:hypothetical protein
MRSPVTAVLTLVATLSLTPISLAGQARSVNFDCTFADPQCYMYQSLTDPAMASCTAYSFRRPNFGALRPYYDYCYSGSLICGPTQLLGLAAKATLSNSQMSVPMYTFFSGPGGAGFDLRKSSNEPWLCPPSRTNWLDPFIITRLEFFACNLGQSDCDWSFE